MTKVAIIDDHQLFLDGISELLGKDKSCEVIFTAVNGLEALQKMTNLSPEVILLDINLPDIDGTDLCKQLIEINPSVKIIALTMHKEVSFLKLMLKNGAKGYLLKNAKKEELIIAINTVFKGGTYFSDEITSTLYQSMIEDGKKNETNPKLSRREKEILALIIDEFTTQEIADNLFITASTVESHRANLLAKLDVRNTAGLVRIAIEKNLLN